MAIKKIKPLYLKFVSELKGAITTVNNIEVVKCAYNPPRGPKIKNSELFIITEISFLKTFMSLENYLEVSFIGYMLGAESMLSRKPKRYIMPKNKEHARKITLKDNNQQFLDWSTIDNVITRAEYTFGNGKPFKPILSAKISVLNDMKKIRNAIAHSSESAQDKFEKIVRNYEGALPASTKITPGEFLLKNRRGMAIRYIDYFQSELKSIALYIAECR